MSLLSKLNKHLGPEISDTPEKRSKEFKTSLLVTIAMLIPLYNLASSDMVYLVISPVIAVALWSYKTYLYSDSYQAKSNKNTETPAL